MAISNEQIWQYWNTNSTTTASVTWDACETCDTGHWVKWNRNYTSAVTWKTWQFERGDWDAEVTMPETDNERVAREQREAQAAEQRRVLAAEQARLAAIRKAEEEMADARAKALLESMLSKAEREEMEQHRYITVEGGKTKRRYRIHTGGGYHGNIKEVDAQGREIRSFCVAPGGDMPLADRVLGQKLYIEMNEDEFHARANVTELRAG